MVVQVLQDLKLCGVRLEIALRLVFIRRSMVVHGTRHVASLACHTLEDEDGRRAFQGVEDACIREHGKRALVDGEVLALAVGDRAWPHHIVLALAGTVEVHEGLVHVEARLLHRRSERIIRLIRDAKGLCKDVLGTAAEAARIASDKRKRRAALKRKRIPVILEKDKPLVSNLLIESTFGICQLRARKILLAVLEVESLGLGIGIVPALVHAQIGVDDRRIVGKYLVGTIDEPDRDGSHGSKNDPFDGGTQPAVPLLPVFAYFVLRFHVTPIPLQGSRNVSDVPAA